MTSARRLLPIPADAAAWHALRAQHVGASEVSILFGVAPPYMPGPWALWQVKAGRAPAPQVDNQRTRWGLLLEDAIAAAAAEREGWCIEPGIYASLGGLGATLDRLIASPGERDQDFDGPGVLELKNVDWIVHRRQWGDEPPAHILLQLQAQLAATGRSWGAVAALVGGNDLQVYRYRARPKLQAEILRRVADFWQSIRENRPPPVDGSDDAARILRILEPEIVDEPADLSASNEAPILCAEYLRAAEDEREAFSRKAAARNGLLALLGGHRWAVVSGYRLSQAVTPEIPDRVAEPGEIIRGRAESRRVLVKELT